MKTIVIIENEAVELSSLVNLFQQWQSELNVLTAGEKQAAIKLLSQQQVDLLVCDLEIPTMQDLDDFSLLTHSFPYVPCIALSKGNARPKDALERGASLCIEKPVDTQLLLQYAGDLLESSTSGTVRGIPIHSFLQMLESEEKTCTLEVDHNKDRGLLYMRNGSLIGAETRNFRGEEAAHLILSWREPVVRIRYFNGKRRRQIDKPLISVILEAHRLREAMEKADDRKSATRHQLPLKHLSTIGKMLPLTIGAPLKIEFPRIEALFDVTMVGMLQDQYLIVTNPKPFADTSEMVEGNQRFIIKYMHDGRVWMFKAQLIKSLESPSSLLFFEYPAVIHYHELRKSRRRAIFVPCTFHFGEEEARYGTLIDLSMTGGLCLIKRKNGDNSLKEQVEEEVKLRCLLPGIKEEQEIIGKMRNVEINENDTRVGIEFTNLQQNLSDTIGKYLYSLDGIAEEGPSSPSVDNLH